MTIGTTAFSPRATNAIVASTIDKTKMVMTAADPKVYVLDRALNYGNSGGPIVAVDTGKVYAFCSRFKPMFVPQPHLQDNEGEPLTIMTPSLYGVVSNLSNPTIIAKLAEVGIEVSDM